MSRGVSRTLNLDQSQKWDCIDEEALNMPRLTMYLHVQLVTWRKLCCFFTHSITILYLLHMYKEKMTIVLLKTQAFQSYKEQNWNHHCHMIFDNEHNKYCMFCIRTIESYTGEAILMDSCSSTENIEYDTCLCTVCFYCICWIVISWNYIHKKHKLHVLCIIQ